MFNVILFLLVGLLSDSALALEDSTTTDTTVNGGADVGLPTPLYCMDNNVLQWSNGNWLCTAIGSPSSAAPPAPTAPSYTYSIQYGAWGSCSGPTKTRTATCKRSDGQTVSMGFCGSAVTTGTCTLTTRKTGSNLRYSERGVLPGWWRNARVTIPGTSVTGIKINGSTYYAILDVRIQRRGALRIYHIFHDRYSVVYQ